MLSPILNVCFTLLLVFLVILLLMFICAVIIAFYGNYIDKKRVEEITKEMKKENRTDEEIDMEFSIQGFYDPI